ncbi:unnamed protein product [Ilex paraguariensis]|uniref:Uncharacterized protein n=1 Tax=Ilex paraguariensis TaxID=185542 RepID=A0ABC8S9S6_9AQUA
MLLDCSPLTPLPWLNQRSQRQHSGDQRQLSPAPPRAPAQLTGWHWVWAFESWATPGVAVSVLSLRTQGNNMISISSFIVTDPTRLLSCILNRGFESEFDYKQHGEFHNWSFQASLQHINHVF